MAASPEARSSERPPNPEYVDIMNAIRVAKDMVNGGQTELTPEQARKARAAQEAITAKFDVPPLHLATMRVSDREGKLRVVVADVAPSGLSRGGLRDILAAPIEDYSIQVEGEVYDARKGMTLATYSTMIELQRSRGLKFLPDDFKAFEHGGRTTTTWLTGEPFDVRSAPETFSARTAHTEHGQVKIHGTVGDAWQDRDRFRPAVVLD